MSKPEMVKLVPPVKTLPSGWCVEATWYANAGDSDRPLSSGPEEVRIWLADDADPSVRARGLTSGVMRALETSIKELAAEIPRKKGRLLSLEVIQARVVANLVADLLPHRGRGPKPDGYYQRLLEVREQLDDDPRVTNPVALIARAMNVPVATVRTQLHTAKKRSLSGDQRA